MRSVVLALLLSLPHTLLALDTISFEWDTVASGDTASFRDGCLTDTWDNQWPSLDGSGAEILRDFDDGLGCGRQRLSAGFSDQDSVEGASISVRNYHRRIPSMEIEARADTRQQTSISKNWIGQDVAWASSHGGASLSLTNERTTSDFPVDAFVESSFVGLIDLTLNGDFGNRPYVMLASISAEQNGNAQLLNGMGAASLRVYDDDTNDLLFDEQLGLGTAQVSRQINFEDRLGHRFRVEFDANIKANGIAIGDYESSQSFSGGISFSVPEPSGVSLLILGLLLTRHWSDRGR